MAYNSPKFIYLFYLSNVKDTLTWTALIRSIFVKPHVYSWSTGIQNYILWNVSGSIHKDKKTFETFLGTGRQWVLKWPNLLGQLTQFSNSTNCGNKDSRWDDMKWAVSVTQYQVLVSNYTWILTQFAATWFKWDATSQDTRVSRQQKQQADVW